jgi:malonate-semialdehyde dehydrogenase (acetylating)/methylmalonate-semialdehyde dehydrogenase
MRQLSHWIGGEADADSGAPRTDVFDPSSGAIIATVPRAGKGTARRAVASAATAYPGWRDTPLSRRTEVLFAYRELLHGHTDEIADLISAELGKVKADARGEVVRGLEVVEYACGVAGLLKGEASQEVATNVDLRSTRHSLGVVLAVTPFNFPAMVPLWMFPLAIACGNTVVLKPSNRVPSAPLRLAELFQEAGLPPGVLNVVHGEAETVEALMGEDPVRAVSFVGSTPVARSVYHTGAARGIRVQALGGAKNHMVVLPDADIAAAAAAAVSAAFGSSGERCMAISVVVAVGERTERLVQAIVDQAARVRVGPSTLPASAIGPVVTAAHRDRIISYIEAGEDEGAELALDGRKMESNLNPEGFWIGPTVFDRVSPDMSIYTDEIFGPVLSIVQLPTLEAAIELINENQFGNGAAVFTGDGSTARRFEREAEVGMIGINVPIPVPLAFYSFGGWKSSLFGDLHIHGPDAIRFYTRGKTITSRWAAGSRRPDLHFPTTR